MIHLCEVPRVTKFIKTEDRMLVSMGWRRRKGSSYLISAEFVVGLMKKFWKWMVGCLHNIVKVHDVTELVKVAKFI